MSKQTTLNASFFTGRTANKRNHGEPKTTVNHHEEECKAVTPKNSKKAGSEEKRASKKRECPVISKTMLTKRKKWAKSNLCFGCQDELEVDDEHEMMQASCQCYKDSKGSQGMLLCGACGDDEFQVCTACDKSTCARYCEPPKKFVCCGNVYCNSCYDETTIWKDVRNGINYSRADGFATDQPTKCNSCQSDICPDCIHDRGGDTISRCNVCKVTSCEDCGIFKMCDGESHYACPKCFDKDFLKDQCYQCSNCVENMGDEFAHCGEEHFW
eukprot:scaffold36943_cov61-Attheya_sp.AAC.2